MPSSSLETVFEVVMTFLEKENADACVQELKSEGYVTPEVREVVK